MKYEPATMNAKDFNKLTEDVPARPATSFGGWDLVGLADEDDPDLKILEFHLIPLDDLKDHEPDFKGACWCRPIQNEEGLWVHNSVDRREDYEDAEN